MVDALSATGLPRITAERPDIGRHYLQQDIIFSKNRAPGLEPHRESYRVAIGARAE